MRAKSCIRWLALLALALSACQPAADLAPLPTANVASIQITPALRWMVPLLNDCARRAGQGIVLDERPTASLAMEQAALVLRWGASTDVPPFAAQLGTDRLALVAHPSNPLETLSTAQLEAIYQGALTAWSEVLPAGSTAPGEEIHAWAYPAGEDIQDWVDSLALEQPARTSAAFLAPQPAAMLQSVATDPAALGVLPARLLDASVKEVTITGREPSALQSSIVAIGARVPEGALREFLGCVQEALN